MALLKALLLALTTAASAQLPIDDRVNALLAQMTLPECIAQLFYSNPPSQDPQELLRLAPLGWGGMALNFPPATRNAIQQAYMNSTRLGIPVSFYAETLRSGGVNNVTIFPVPALLGSSWNASLAEAIGRVAARELWASGGDRSFSPVLQVTTDPRWGRLHENFGECDLLVALMGAGMTRGLLNGGGGGGPSTYLPSNFSLIPFAKHFYAYGPSNADGFTVSSSPRELREVFLKPWREFVAAGGRGAMISHPAVNGIPMHANAAMLALLRSLAPAFQGALLGSDNENVRWLSQAFRYSASDAAAAADAVLAGVDQEMDGFSASLYLQHLPAAAAASPAIAAAVRRAAGNVLRAKFAAGLFDVPPQRDPALPAQNLRTPPALALAREAVLQGAVLLANGNAVLPMPALGAAGQRIALLGPNAGLGCPSDTTQGCAVRANWVGAYSPYSTGANGPIAVPTMLDALRSRFPGALVDAHKGADIDRASAFNSSQLAEAVAAAAAADVVVLVLGDSACVGTGFGEGSCCEGADRTSLDLPGSQQALLRAVLNATGNLAGLTPPDGAGWTPYARPGGPTPLCVILIHGRPATFDAAGDNWLVPGASPTARAALVSAWQPSEAGAHALLDLLTGRENFSGRTATTWPRSVGHLNTPGHPWLQQPNSQGAGLWLPPREGLSGNAGNWAPLFPLGFGLDYTSWAISGLQLPPQPLPIASTQAFNVTLRLGNTGPRDGAAVIFVAYSVTVEGVLRYARRVAGFARSPVVAAGGEEAVSVLVRVGDLERWDEGSGAYVVDAGAYTLHVGTCLVGTGVLPDSASACAQLVGSVSLV